MFDGWFFEFLTPFTMDHFKDNFKDNYLIFKLYYYYYLLIN
jgi:hypothetical protein